MRGATLGALLTADEASSVTAIPDKKAPITVMVVDDHALMRSGIAAVVNAEPDMAAVVEAGTGLDALARYREWRPAVTLMDLRMRDMDGIQAMAAIRRECPIARIVMLTVFRGDFQARRALQAGASGYLLKDVLHTDLVDTIRRVHRGEVVVPPNVDAELAEHAFGRILSLRETQVLNLVAFGKGNREVAEQLALTEETVKVHMRTILSKLGARDRTHAVTIALRRGMLDL